MEIEMKIEEEKERQIVVSKLFYFMYVYYEPSNIIMSA